MSYSILYLIVQIVISNAAPANDSEPQVEPIIIHGTPVRIEEFPFFAATDLCGGTIISERWILTAAHCVHTEEKRGNYVVYVGGERKDNSFAVKYKRVLIHPLFIYDLTIYDIALLELETPLQFSAKVQPAKLPRSLTSNPSLVFIGRGYDETGLLSDTLKKMDFFREDSNACANILSPNLIKQLKEHSIFCGTRTDRLGPGACEGDSGSPVLDHDTVIGVLSFYRYTGIKNCNNSKFASFTNVAFFMDWITNVTGLRY